MKVIEFVIVIAIYSVVLGFMSMWFHALDALGYTIMWICTTIIYWVGVFVGRKNKKK